MKLSLGNTKEIKFKEEMVNGQSVTIVFYNISNTELWSIPYALEARGITFNTETGNVIARPFEKFFNVGENSLLTWSNINSIGIKEVFDKRDGSMISPVLLNSGEIMFKTKKSFYSEVAILANKYATSEVIQLSRKLIENGFSPIFELTIPENQVVLYYDYSQPFTLLAARNLNTGEYLNTTVLFDIAKRTNVPFVDQYNLTSNELLEKSNTETDIEGWVIVLNNGVRAKIKTTWYYQNHRIRTDMRIRDVAEMIADEKIDEVKAIASMSNLDITPIEDIERNVSNEINSITTEVDLLVEQVKNLSKKEAALFLNGNIYFSLVMTATFSNKEVDYTSFWKKNYLKKYPLTAVYNNKF